MVISGYLPQKRNILVKLRRQVIEKYDGLCNICGKAGNGIDYI